MSQRSNLQLENAVLRSEAAEYEVSLTEAAVVIDDLTAALWAAKRQIDELERIAKVGKYAPKPRPRVVIPQEELDRRARVAERMAEAKAQAMASKVSVLA